MTKYITASLWQEALQHADWYLWIKDEFRRLEILARQNPHSSKQIKAEVYDLVENAIIQNKIILAKQGTNLDVERQPIDRAIIHHTKNQPGMSLTRLNAMQLLRIYGMYYANPTDPREKDFKGQPVWSGHFYKGQQVFWGYHWFVRQDGTAEQILDDAYIGWHAGNWDINTRSIGICIDNDLSETGPSDVVLASIAKILRQSYPQITSGEVFGHREVNQSTVCPGGLFIPSWKDKLLSLLEVR